MDVILDTFCTFLASRVDEAKADNLLKSASYDSENHNETSFPELVGKLLILYLYGFIPQQDVKLAVVNLHINGAGFGKFGGSTEGGPVLPDAPLLLRGSYRRF